MNPNQGCKKNIKGCSPKRGTARVFSEYSIFSKMLGDICTIF